MLNEQPFDILKEDFDFHQEILPNCNYKLHLYSNFLIESIFIDSISSNHFETIRNAIHLNPLVTFSFEKANEILYFIFVCQNYCCVIQIDDEERLRLFLNSIENVTMVASKKKDLKTLKEYVETPKFLFLNEEESLDSRYDSKTLKRHYYKIDKLAFDDRLTIGKYLFLSSLPLFSFFLRRNYFPTSTFIDSSFFYPPIIQQDQSNKTKKKIPKLEESDFLKIRVIGYGSNSVICLVVQKITGFVYALRTITQKNYYKCEYEYFEKNIHQRIIHCYGVVSQGANKAFVLDFMSNGSLKDKTIADPNLRSKIIYQILVALDHLHSHGLVHCDIKPSSILLNRDYDVCLSGFAHLQEFVFIDKKTIKVDLFPFLAPEIICSSDKCSFHADLYSLGVLIYVLTTGKKPYENITLLESIKKGIAGDVDKISITEGQITRLFEQCISADKNIRSSSFILRRLFEKKFLFYSNTDEEFIVNCIENMKMEKEDEKKLIDSDERIDFKFILSNAQNGNPVSQYNLGLMYSNGWIVEQNHQQAFEWFSKAAEKNYAPALFEVGLFFHKKADKIKIPFDYAKSYEMYKKAADQNLSDAENGIGELYVEGQIPPIEENVDNFAKAFEFFSKAADKGNHHSQCNLGKLLLSGKIGQIDVKKAIEYFNLAASQGNDEAEISLAKIYSEGKIVPKNDQKAAQFYKKAAYHKRHDAMKEYGKILIEGIGVNINKEEGEKWIRKSEEIQNESLTDK